MATILEKLRVQFTPRLPDILQSVQTLVPARGGHIRELGGEEGELAARFSKLLGQHPLHFKEGKSINPTKPLRVGVVLSGGQAAGGHNVIIGLFDALKKLNSSSQLFGFLDGPSGIIKNKHRELNAEELHRYRNTGGFDLLGSGRTKIETPEQFAASLETVRHLKLDGLVIIGGDDSNTNAALLAQYFLENQCATTVVGVPKTIDGDLKNQFIEISFGFDTACKTYSEIIGNIMRDTLSAKKYWYFAKLMGRSASHVTLEVALQTHPNLAWIGEEIQEKRLTLADLVNEAADLIIRRSEKGKDYGIVLIPEGIIEFIPELKQLIKELNVILAKGKKDIAEIEKALTSPSKQSFEWIPDRVREQLLFDRDPHGNVQVSKIETERLFITMVEQELKRRNFKGKFAAQPLFLGYEGRAPFPSNFDCQYCYALGQTAALLVNEKATGYISCVRNLTEPVEDWTVGGVPLIAMIHQEERNGKIVPVIEKALVDLDGPVFAAFEKVRDHWKLADEYRFTGPIQFWGPTEITDVTTLTLDYEKEETELWAY
jgi:pyrophosphate--fructose-6-phosphate 1-phosphotransferase